MNNFELAKEAAEKQIAEQDRLSKEAIEKQIQTERELSAEVKQREVERFKSWLGEQKKEKNHSVDENFLPAMPSDPGLFEGSAQEKRDGEKALQAYKDAGFVAHSENAAVSVTSQTNAADFALAQEREFRQRQQHLADRISDPKTSPEQRERLQLQKAVEFHDHHADCWERVASLQQDLGQTKESTESKQKIDQHKEQAAFAANKLHQFDQKNGLTPLEVQEQLRFKEKENSTSQTQKDVRDPDSKKTDSQADLLESGESFSPGKKDGNKSAEQKSAAQPNPAAARMLQQRQERAKSFDESAPRPNHAWVNEKVAEAKQRENDLRAGEAVAKQQAAESSHVRRPK